MNVRLFFFAIFFIAFQVHSDEQSDILKARRKIKERIPREYASDALTAEQVQAQRTPILEKFWTNACDPLRHYLLARYNYEADARTCGLVEDFLVALSFFPEKMMPLQFSKLSDAFSGPITSGQLVDPGTLMMDAYAETSGRTIFAPTNLSFKAKPTVVGTLIHEVAHQIDEIEGDLSRSAEWLSISGWDRVEKLREKHGPIRTELSNLKFILKHAIPALSQPKIFSIYSTSTPFEDFAETVTGFLVAPEELRRVSPARYQYVAEKVFKTDSRSPANIIFSETTKR